MMLSPPSAKKLSSMPTRSSPSTSANSAHSSSSCGVRGPRIVGRGEVRRRQRLAVELAVGRERKLVQRHERRRHHVVRQAGSRDARAMPQHRELDRRLPPPHRPPAACCRARSSRAITAACATLGMPQQRRLDLARLDAEAAQLHLRVGAPEEVEHPVRAPARQIAGAVHPAAGRPERIGHEPLRRQPGAPEIAPRQPRARDVELARNPGRQRAASPRPGHKRDSWSEDDRSGCGSRLESRPERRRWHRCSTRWGHRCW